MMENAPTDTGEHDDGPADPEEFPADDGVDPMPQEIAEHRERMSEPSPEPLEPSD